MQLTEEERGMLQGRQGKAVKKSMEILVSLGEIFGAERLIPVSSVQISGVSYHNLGDAGLEFLNEMAEDGRVRVFTTMNPAGMDLQNWKDLGISEEFAEKQLKVIGTFKRMGVRETCSCVPYLIGNSPKKGQHIAWGESSAVTFANSVLGAYTNKEGGPSTIAAALTGKTAEYSLHLDKNRQAEIAIEVKTGLKDVEGFGALGCAYGRKYGDKIPIFTGIKGANIDELKALSASIVTYKAPAIFHIKSITPNKTEIPAENGEITEKDIEEARAFMNDDCEVDFVLIGCPHASIEEIRQIAELIKGKKVTKEFWIATARAVKEQADKLSYSKVIEDCGAKFAVDTCHVVAPLKGRFKAVALNSAKGVYYARGQNDMKTVFKTLEECVDIATR